MKKILFFVLCAMMMLPLAAQSGETQLNNEYQTAIREYLAQDVQRRQKTMQRRAEQTLIALPNEE